MEKSKVMGHIFAIITILVWGSCFVLTKNLLVDFTPIQIIPLRMGLAYVTLWVLRPKTLKLPWKDELMFILIGITGGSFYFYLQNTALDHTYAANVSILVAMSPILTVLLAQLFSRNNERLGKYVYIGAVIAIAGVVLVVLNGQMSFHLSPIGDLLALAASGLYQQGLAQLTPGSAQERLGQYLADHLAEELTSEKICRALSLSRTGLYYLSRQTYGCGINEQITRLRIQKAMELLASTKLPNNEICRLTGFPDYNYFYRVFRRQTGLTPRQYRTSIVSDTPDVK